MDRSSEGSPSGSLGGQVSNVTSVLADADENSYFHLKSLVFSFSTSSHLFPGDSVFIRISGFSGNLSTARVINSNTFGESLSPLNSPISSSTVFVNVSSAAPAGRYSISIVGFGLESKSEKATVFISTSKDFENSGFTSNTINIVRMTVQHRVQYGVDVASFEPFFSSGVSSIDALAASAFELWKSVQPTQSVHSDSQILFPTVKLSAASVVAVSSAGIGLFQTVDLLFPFYLTQYIRDSCAFLFAPKICRV
jgi:hypothetical protein